MLCFIVPNMKVAIVWWQRFKLVTTRRMSEKYIETCLIKYKNLICLPQVVEMNTPQPQDVAGECLLYHEYMTRVYVSDAKKDELAALRLLILDLKMQVAGEATDWPTTLVQVPVNRIDMLVIDWDLLPSPPGTALDELRKACPTALVVVLISHLSAIQQAALSAGADAFISKSELPERVAEHLLTVAESVRR